MHTSRRFEVFIACLVFAAAAGCSDESRDDGDAAALKADGVLQYVPADTPYVAAAAEPLPGDIRDALVLKMRPVMEAYAEMLRVAMREGAGEEAGELPLEELTAEVALLMTPEGLESAGIDRDSTMAVYGLGLWPVLRVSLSDESLMEGTLGRLEEKAGAKMATATVDGHSYRIAEGEDDATVVIAVLDGYLVAGLVPPEPGDDLLRSVLGLELPAENIAEAGVLSALAEKYRYTSYGLGYLDVRRVADMFLDGESGVPQEILDEAGFEASGISEVCREETRAIAAVMPRIATGYTEVSADLLATNTVVELRSDLAAGLRGVTAPVPGLGRKGQAGGLFTFGMGIDPRAAREFYAARLDALEADPYECEWYADLQSGVARGRAALDQPLPPVVYSFRGFLAVIQNISGMDLEAGQPPSDMDLQLLLATDNAEALVAMGAMFSPEIAALDLKPDSKPVRLPVPPAAGQIETAYVAMSDKALALSVGEGGEARLPQMLSASMPDPAPFFSLDMDAGAYYGFIGDAVSHADRDDEEQKSVEFQQAFSRTMNTLAEAIDRISFDIHFTERGIEFPSTVVLAE